MGRNTFSGCFDLRLSWLRQDSRAAQHDKLEAFFEENDFPELLKSNYSLPNNPVCCFTAAMGPTKII
jgi:hypothetical protein